MRIPFNTSYLLLGLLLGLFSCKETESVRPSPVAKADPRDSVLFIARELYLWNTALPSSLKGTSYSTPAQVIDAVRTYSPVNPFTGKNTDRWSFVLSAQDYGNMASASSDDIGLGYRFTADTDLRVREVDPNSPAEKAGVKRGWQVLRINNIECKRDNIDALNAALANSSISYVFSYTEAGNAKTKEVTLTAAGYSSPTVSYAKVIEQGGKKIGYLKFSTFFGDAIKELDAAFATFQASGVQAVVIDLRYNGGGRVDIAEHLANLLAPASAKGKAMYTDTHNDKYSVWNETANFDTRPATLPTLQQVAFLTTSSAASASEMVINVLQPYLGDKLAVVGSATNGKPFGMYPIPIMRKTERGEGEYYAAPLAVRSVNALGVGDYINGIQPTVAATDDLTKDFGDTEEASLKAALAWIGGAQIASVPASRLRLAERLEPANRLLDKKFKGMFHELPRK